MIEGFTDGPLFGLPLVELWFGLLLFVLGMFLVLDGFDFGIGALFLARDDHEEKETLLAVIGPFWDGNEVWLVVFGGVLFAVFPAAYAGLFSRNYLLMFAILGALILRGLAPEFYEQREDAAWQRAWGLAFGVGSVAAPFLLGMFVANWMLGATGIVTVAGVVVGLAVVALSVADGVAFLGMKTRTPLRREAVPYGIGGIAAYLGLVVAALGYLYLTRPDLQAALLSPVTLGVVAVSVVLAGVYVVFLRDGHYLLAFVAVAGVTFALVAFVGALLYPMVDPAADLSVADAAVSTLPLNIMTVFGTLLIPLVLTYFAVVYSVFSGPIEAGETY
ncbi:cytochrome d ubiquinol oxidase subunit II [Halobacteriaceae archaeon GCM10025711]